MISYRDLWCHGARYVRHCVAARGKRPCAFSTYSTQEAGTRSPYLQYGGSGAYVSTQKGACDKGEQCRVARAEVLVPRARKQAQREHEASERLRDRVDRYRYR